MRTRSFRMAVGLITLTLSGGAFAAEPENDEVPRRIAVGSEGYLSPGVLVQTWVGADLTGGTKWGSTFRVRRADMYMRGELLRDQFAYVLMFDLARLMEAVTTTVVTPGGSAVDVRTAGSTLSVLQDVMLTWQSKYADVTAGQFKIPISADAYLAPSQMLFPDRSLVAREWSDKRDLGLRVTKRFQWLSYTFCIFNGAGQGTLDTNMAKDLALRFDVYPIKGMTVSAAEYSSVGHRELPGTRDRWEADLRFERGPGLVLGEFFHARDVGPGGAVTFSQGFTAMGAWAFTKQWVPAVRVSRLDPNLHRPLDQPTDKRDEFWMFEAGLNYLLKGHEVKFQAWYGRQQFDHHVAVDQALLTAQAWF